MVTGEEKLLSKISGVCMFNIIVSMPSRPFQEVYADNCFSRDSTFSCRVDIVLYSF